MKKNKIKHKTNTYDMLTTIVFAVWYLKKANVSEIANKTKLDRMSVARNIEILEHLCVLKVTGKRVKYYEIEPEIEKLLKNKGHNLMKDWMRGG